MIKLFLALVGALCLYEFIVLLSRLRLPESTSDIHEDARLHRLRQINKVVDLEL